MEGMSGMGGMDMSDHGPFRPTNTKIALSYWYTIAAIVGTLTLVRLVTHIQRWHRLRRRQHDHHCIPSRPVGPFTHLWATMVAIAREMAYSQPVFFTGQVSKYFTPLPIGKWLVLAIYWIVLLCFLWTNTILSPSSPMYGYKWEIVGFRAAWVSVTQIPFIYLLSCKFNPISILTGISYERFNWLHRWAARTVFLTIIVHWSFFFTEWALGDIVSLEFSMMPMVKYGFGAWATIGWMIISGFGFWRNLCYELWVLQHIAAAATLLWLLYVHVPQYARYNIYMAIAFLAFDWGCRMTWIALRNTNLIGRSSSRAPGYAVKLEPLPGNVTKLSIEHVDFTWRAGQHVYISIPRLRPFEWHPFTIANAAESDLETHFRCLNLVVQARSGFSGSIRKAAVENLSNSRLYQALLSGPWGKPPILDHFDSVVLIACATGASFVLPILQDLMSKPRCARNIHLHWIIRHEEHLAWYEQEIMKLVDVASATAVSLYVSIHVTQPRDLAAATQTTSEESSVGTDKQLLMALETNFDTESNAGSVVSVNEKTLLSPVKSGSLSSMISCGRPNVESMILPAVEGAVGETAIVVCGGVSITAQTRTFVVALSDARGVHKGTGAQGIFLFTETFGW